MTVAISAVQLAPYALLTAIGERDVDQDDHGPDSDVRDGLDDSVCKIPHDVHSLSQRVRTAELRDADGKLSW